MMTNPYAPTNADAGEDPEAALPRGRVTDILWFIPGGAMGFVFGVILTEGLATVMVRSQTQPLESVLFFFQFGLFALAASSVWRLTRRAFRPRLIASPRIRFASGFLMSFMIVAIMSGVEAMQLFGRAFNPRIIVLVASFLVTGVFAVEFEAYASRAKRQRLP